MLVVALGLSLTFVSLPVLAAPEAEVAPEGEPAGEAEAAPEAIDTEQRAMTAFNDGQAAYERGDYSAALNYFLEAQSLYPSPLFHYNIGRCYEALENYEQAIISYEAYLRSYKSALGEDPEDKVTIENTIKRLQKLVEAQRAEDEAKRNKPPVIVIQEKEGPPGRALIITGSVLLGVGAGAAAGGGVAFGLMAGDASAELDQLYDEGNPERLTLADAREIDRRGRMAEVNQIVFISVGSALAITGVALLSLGVVKAKQARTAKPIEDQPSVSFTPAFGGGTAGLLIHGRF